MRFVPEFVRNAITASEPEDNIMAIFSNLSVSNEVEVPAPLGGRVQKHVPRPSRASKRNRAKKILALLALRPDPAENFYYDSDETIEL